MSPSGPLDLRPKCFDVLHFLVQHADRVVSKDEILDAVWPNVTVNEESLTQCISEIRRAIGDERRQIIKTIARRGYLFDPLASAGHGSWPSSAADPLATKAQAGVATGAADSRLARIFCIAVALVAIVVIVGTNKPHDIQGSWQGFLNCEKLPFTTGPLVAAPFEITVSGSGATYKRQVYTADGSAVLGTENGTGTLTVGGTVKLVGQTHPVPENAPVSYKAFYSGRLTDPIATLRGTQEWLFRGEQILRHCAVQLERDKRGR